MLEVRDGVAAQDANKINMMFFTADWSIPGIAMQKVLERLLEFEDEDKKKKFEETFVVHIVDYEKGNQNFFLNYGVQSVPVIAPFIVNEDGFLVMPPSQALIGVAEEEMIIEFFKESKKKLYHLVTNETPLVEEEESAEKDAKEDVVEEIEEKVEGDKENE